ncbi:MAG: PH domain-containing protein [Bacilli bacterium]|jgi:membrane protein YdbS with pleckstrin-like domain
MDKNQTAKILMKDEKVLYTIKPCKTKLVVSSLLTMLFVIGLSFLTFLIPAEEGDDLAAKNMWTAIGVGVVAAVMILVFICQLLAYRNRFYTVTDKRFIIQSGLLGIDFASVPVEAVQFLSVNVSVLDKILRRGTGSITFGTVSTPIAAQNQATGFRYGDIPNVYENYKVFKELIDNAQQSKE